MKFISLFKCKFEGKMVDSFPISNGEAELVSFCQLVSLCGFKSWKWISTTFIESFSFLHMKMSSYKLASCIKLPGNNKWTIRKHCIEPRATLMIQNKNN